MFFKNYRKQRNIKKCAQTILDIMSQYEENTSIVMKLSEHYSFEVITCAAYRVSIEKGLTIVFKDSKYVIELIEDEKFESSVIAYDNCKSLSGQKYILLPFKYTDNLYQEIVEDKDNQYIVLL